MHIAHAATLKTTTSRVVVFSFHNIGTLITLEKVSFFADGRSLITAVGSSRFQVEEYGTCDGYATAKVNTVTDDENVDQEKQAQLLSISNEVGCVDGFAYCF